MEKNDLSLLFTRKEAHISAMDTTNRDAVEELLQTYGETGGINYLDAAATSPRVSPSKQRAPS